ncbi:MAG: DUF4915 domain-containing protein [Chthoniobacteraceae bacterium]
MSARADDFHRSFLVTCVGAYDDSGMGTGGFVSVHDGVPTIVDAIDSTGLCESDGVYYRCARGLRSIIGYDRQGLRSVLKISDARDVHDIALQNGEFLCVSTGTNEALWIDPLGRTTRRWKADGDRDAWHLNCFCEVDGRLHFAAFGRFDGHRGWVGKCNGTGVVFDHKSGRDVVTGLNGPHNPRCFDGTWFVCDSHAGALVRQMRDGRMDRIDLGGFTRGFASDARYFYIGVSADRKAPEPSEKSSIVVIERTSMQAVGRVEIPFPEIYDIALIAPEFSAAVAANLGAFQIDREPERFAALETQVNIGRREIEELRRRLEPLETVERIRGSLVHLKRRLLG